MNLKSACDRQWEKPDVAAVDRPAGWITPAGARLSKKGTYWEGEPHDLWRTRTKKPAQMRPKTKRPAQDGMRTS